MNVWPASRSPDVGGYEVWPVSEDWVSISSSISARTLESGKLAATAAQIPFLPVLLLNYMCLSEQQSEAKRTLSLCPRQVLARQCWGFSVATIDGGHFLTVL